MTIRDELETRKRGQPTSSQACEGSTGEIRRPAQARTASKGASPNAQSGPNLAHLCKMDDVKPWRAGTPREVRVELAV